MSDPSDVMEAVTALGEACARIAIGRYGRIAPGGTEPGPWADRYLLGLVQGMITGQCLPYIGRVLDEQATGVVILTTLRNVGADATALALSMVLVSTRDPSFMRGYDDALISTLIMMADLNQEQAADPDVLQAIAIAPQVRESFDVPAPLEMDDDLAAGIAFLDIRALRNIVQEP